MLTEIPQLCNAFRHFQVFSKFRYIPCMLPCGIITWQRLTYKSNKKIPTVKTVFHNPFMCRNITTQFYSDFFAVIMVWLPALTVILI